MCEKLEASELTRRYPHVQGKLAYAAASDTINRSKPPGAYYWRYHLDEDFERWQAKYLPRKPVQAVLQETINLPARREMRDPVAERLQNMVLDRAAMLLLERAGLLSTD